MTHTATHTAASNSDELILADMLGELGMDDEIVEDASTLEAAVADIAKTEAAVAVYENEDHEHEEVAAADRPSTDADAVTKPKKEKKAKVAKEPKEPKEPKAPRITSVTHKPGDRLVALLGGTTWLQFIGKDDEETKAIRAQQFIEAMNSKDAIADKVREKAIMLFTWMASGKDSSALNEVLLRSFQVLLKDGELTSGKAGNLQTNLLGKPYSPGTAASQANQMFMLFPLLLITQREKGKMVANPDSAILEVMKIKLGM
jgi:hypothetical protein